MIIINLSNTKTIIFICLLFLLLFKMLLVLNKVEKIDLFKVNKVYDIREYFDDCMLELLYKNAEVGVHG